MSRMMTALGLSSMALSSVACGQDTPTITIPGVEQIIPIDIQVLSLYDTKVTDVGMKELAALKSLIDLELTRTNVTDAGLKELAALKSLTTLRLSVTQVTDAGVKKLAAALKSLTWLSLSNTQVTGACVKELRAKLPKCKIYN